MDSLHADLLALLRSSSSAFVAGLIPDPDAAEAARTRATPGKVGSTRHRTAQHRICHVFCIYPLPRYGLTVPPQVGGTPQSVSASGRKRRR